MMVFPEMRDSFKDEIVGNYQKGIISIDRIKNIAESTIGKVSNFSVLSSLRLMELYDCNMNLKSAIEIANNCPYFDKSSGETNKNLKPHILHKKAEISLKACDPILALTSADEAIDCLESDDKSNANINLLSTAYGLKGLSSLFLGKFTDAEDFLQLSSRWSTAIAIETDPKLDDIETKTRQIISLSNLGYFFWYKSYPLV